MIIDTHAHYDSEQFEEDRDQVITSLPEQGVAAVVNMGASLEGCYASVELAKTYPFMYAAVGIHPDDAGELNEERFEELKKLCKEEKVVAVGEIGLDYHWMVSPEDIQKKWFIRQLDLARELDLPVNIHSRDATEDTLEIMKEHGAGLKGIIHCFSGSREIAAEYVKLGFHIGVGGVVTFKNGKKLRRVVERVPLEMLVLETDCPYLAPEPFRGKRNHSDYIRYVAEEVAHLKGVSCEEVLAQTEKNAREIYGI